MSAMRSCARASAIALPTGSMAWGEAMYMTPATQRARAHALQIASRRLGDFTVSSTSTATGSPPAGEAQGQSTRSGRCTGSPPPCTPATTALASLLPHPRSRRRRSASPPMHSCG